MLAGRKIKKTGVKAKQNCTEDYFGLRWQVGRDTAFAVHKIPACLAAADFALLSQNQFL